MERICSAPSLGIREECVYFPLREQEIHALFQRDYQLRAASLASLITELFSGRCAANGASWGGLGLALGKTVVITTEGGGENMDKAIASRREVGRLSHWSTRPKPESLQPIKGRMCHGGSLSIKSILLSFYIFLLLLKLFFSSTSKVAHFEAQRPLDGCHQLQMCFTLIYDGSQFNTIKLSILKFKVFGLINNFCIGKI